MIIYSLMDLLYMLWVQPWMHVSMIHCLAKGACVCPPVSQILPIYTMSIVGRARLHKARLLVHPIAVPCPHGNDLLAAARTMGARNGSGAVIQTKRGRPY